MVRGILVVAEEMLGDERPHGDREVGQGGGEREPHALAARFASELKERGFLFFCGRDEAGPLGELGHSVIPVHERLGELALDEACENILTLLGHDGGRGVMLSMLRGERLIARLDGAQGQQGRMRIKREDAVSSAASFSQAAVADERSNPFQARSRSSQRAMRTSHSFLLRCNSTSSVGVALAMSTPGCLGSP